MRRTLVEPTVAGGRPNRMFADTDAIRAFGAANSAQAAELAAVAARLVVEPGAELRRCWVPSAPASWPRWPTPPPEALPRAWPR